MPALRTGLCFRLGCCLRGDGLVDLEIGHLQFAEKIEEQGVFFRREIALRLFVESVQHINQLAGGFGVDHRLAGARVGISAENHGGVAAEHADEILKCRGARGGSRRGRRRSLGGCFRGGRRRMNGGLAASFPLLLFDNFLAQLSLWGEGPAVDDAKCFFVLLVLVVGQSEFLSSCVLINFSIGWLVLGSGERGLA